MNPENLLTLKNISKKYFSNGIEKQVLSNINLEIAENSFVSLFGPNGSGKTTLLNIITGILKEDKGEITFKYKDIKDSTSYIFQNFSDSLFPNLTCFQNIAFPLVIKRYPKEQIRKFVNDIVKDIGITFSLDSYPYQCSGGQKQLVTIARALVTKPRFLVLDEPFASLDYETRLSLEEKLMEIWEKVKFTIILVSHDVEEAIYLADRLILLGGKPSVIVKELEIDLPRPRTLDVIKTEEFFKLKRDALDIFEVNRK